MKTLVFVLSIFAAASLATGFFVLRSQIKTAKYNQEVMAGTLYNRALEAQYYAEEATDHDSKLKFQGRAEALLESSKFIKNFDGVEK